MPSVQVHKNNLAGEKEQYGKKIHEQCTDHLITVLEREPISG
jgi:hypothetical protein